MRDGVPAYRLLGVTVDAMRFDDLVGAASDAIDGARQCLIGNHNLHSVYLYHRDPDMRRFCERADYVFIDGMPLVLLGKAAGLPLRREHRLTAVDWLPPLMRIAAERRWRVFLLGSRPGIPERAAGVLLRRTPELQLAVAHGYFDQRRGGRENREMLERIRRFGPQLLIVGMGMPRQERWICDNLADLEANVIMNQGAFMDYVAGAVPTPPRWLAGAGLEWAARLAHEPRRLWRRYMIEPLWLLPAAMQTIAAAAAGASLRVERANRAGPSPDVVMRSLA